MPRMIIKLTDADKSWYLEYSTIVDAPLFYGMSLEEFKEYYREEYGNYSMNELEERLKRVEATGTSSRIHDSVEDTIRCNRAGKNETCLSLEQMVQHYCRCPKFESEEEFHIYDKNRPVGKND